MGAPGDDQVADVIGSMAVGYVTLDRDWVMTRVNAAAEPVLGRPAAELVGRDLWEMFPGARDLEFGRVYERVMTTRRAESFEAYYPGLDVWFELRVQPADDGLAVYFLDVTARHEADERADLERVRAETSARRLQLLADVGEVLAVTGNPDEAVGRLAEMVVPELADWSVVTVIDEDGNLRDVGWAHRDPARAADVAAYGAIQSASMSEDSPVATGLRTGTPVVIPYLSDEGIEAALDEAEAVAIAKRLSPHGVAVMPLTARGRTLGMIALVTTRERGAHTEEELTTALEVARRAGPVLESARLAQRSSRLAETMQRSLLEVSPAGEGVHVATRYRPAYMDREVGGDWYDTFAMPDGSTVITIGDVMGHDISAIAAMARLRTMLRATAWTLRRSPAEVLAATDAACFGLGSAAFATAVYADLRPVGRDGTMRLRWSNAGHPPPLLLGPDGVVTELRTESADPPLGVVPGLVRRDHDIEVRAGSTLLLYTDGLIERRDRDIDAGIRELAGRLGTLGPTSPEVMLDRLMSTLELAAGRDDDVALLAALVGRRPAEQPSVPEAPARALPAGPAAAAVARHHVGRAAAALPAEIMEDAKVLVSELVTNAVRYGHPPITLQIQLDPDSLRVGVRDRGPGRPVMSVGPVDPARTTGRGLLIIDALARRWGTEQAAHDVGKTVWFELPAQ